MNSNSLLDDLKTRTGSTSDNALARHILKVDPTALRDMRERGLSDARVIQIATLLEINVGEALAAIHAERAKSPAEKRAWLEVAKSLRNVAAALLALIGIGLTTAPEPAQAAHNANSVYYVKRRRENGYRAIAAGFTAVSCLPSPGFAADPWSDQDKALEIAYLTLTAIDCRQTLIASKYPAQYAETNMFLGEHPSDSKINTACAAAMLAHVAVTHFLPAKDRVHWQMFWIMVEASAAANNAQIGIRLEF